jgi:hypothetical protein
MNLPEIKVEKKTGQEKFLNTNGIPDFKLIDFWSWNQSDLIVNITRGVLSEFIIKQLLEIKSETRIEWDDYDLISNSGKKIEVKSSSYIQSWKQKKYSEIEFDISPTRSDSNDYGDIKKRWSDYYIFCTLKNKDQNTLNPLDLEQWDFYVLETKILDEKKPNQKKIRLNPLLKLNPVKCKYNELKEVIDN